METFKLFRYSTPAANEPAAVPAFWLQSTAPLNVNDDSAPSIPDNTVTLLAPQAVEQLADELLSRYDESGNQPHLVITMHGFNNPVNVAWGIFLKMIEVVNGNDLFKNRQNLVCLGYAWPSEGIGWPFGSSLKAAPGFAFGFSALLAALYLVVFGAGRGVASLLLGWPSPLSIGRAILLALLFGVMPFGVLILMRSLIYWRDTYRATQYGTPDLIDLLRQLHRALEVKTDKQSHGAKMRVQLSFVGHSLGSLVVTNTVRILSDAFDPNSIGPNTVPGPEIGSQFELQNLVLVAPDISAEAIMTRRGNYLASSLSRFREAHLFSNEGDEVLRFISNLANYISFPTTARRFGFRLGNVEVQGQPFGIVNLAQLREWCAQNGGIERIEKSEWPHLTETQLGDYLHQIRVGDLALDELQKSVQTLPFDPATRQLPLLFTYFDCTDYRDSKGNQKNWPYLTFGRQKDRLSWLDNWKLLFQYLLLSNWKKYVDVHSGYFSGPIAAELIFGLAVCGAETIAASLHDSNSAPASNDNTRETPPLQPPDTAPRRGAPDAKWDSLSALCKARSIRVMLSPRYFLTPPATLQQDGSQHSQRHLDSPS